MKFSRALRLAFLGSVLLGLSAFAAEGELAALTAKAEKGNAIAQYNLGLAYAEGRGVPADSLEAYVWLSLAREHGARGRALDNLAAKLSAAELDQARATLAARRAALGFREPVATAPAPASAPTDVAAPATTPPAAAAVTSPEPTNAAEQELAQARLDKQQLSAELAAAWKEADQLKTEVERLRAAPPQPDTEQLRRERDALSAKLTDLAGDVATLRADRERLQRLAAQAQKDYSEAREISRAYQEQTRVSEARVGELVRQSEQLQAELGRAQESIAALQAPRPTVEHPELAQKTRELAAARSELADLQRAHGELRAALQRTADDQRTLEGKTAQAQAAALEFGQQLETARAQLAELEKRPRAPAYPDLRASVAQLESELAAARSAAPAYPNLSQRVAELEAQLATERTKPAAPDYPDLRPAVAQLERELATARDAAPAYPDLRANVAQLERELQAARTASPAYPDTRAQVAALEQQLAAAQSAAPAYPDLSSRVTELETQLAAARAQPPAPAYPDLRPQVAQLERDLDSARHAAPAYPDTREQVATLQRELDSLRSAPPAYPDLRANVAQLEHDLAAARHAAPAYPDLRERVSDLEAQVAALRDAGPAFPDLRGRVAELERELANAAARPAAPSYPDLRPRTRELESDLARATERAASAETRLAALASAKDGVDAEVASLRAQLSRSETAAATAQDEAAKLRAAGGELERALADARREARPTDPAYPDLRKRVAELTAQLSAAQRAAEHAAAEHATQGRRLAAVEGDLADAQKTLAAQTAAPAYPDLRDRVSDLERRLAAAAQRPSAPAYPDLTERVNELESALATARAQLAAPSESTPTADAASDAASDPAELARQLAETEGKLATALRGYSLLQKEHDELQSRAEKSAGDLAGERDALSARLAASEEAARSAQAEVTRLGESLAALQRSSSQSGTELASVRALLQQVQGAHAVLARENYDLKAALARDPSRDTLTPAAASSARLHTVAAGDSLSKISQRYYGTPSRWQEIFHANRDTVDASGAIRVGMTLRVP